MVLVSDRGAEKRKVEETDGDITMQRSNLSEDQFQRPQAKHAGSGQNYAFSLQSCMLKELEFSNCLMFFFFTVSVICNFNTLCINI